VKDVDGTREVSSSIDEMRPEMRIVVDREKASAYGLSAYTIASTAKMAIGGSTVTRYTTGSEEIDVRIMLAEEARDSVQEIGSISIMSPLGYSVPLNQVANIDNVTTPNTITRSNQVRESTVSGDIFGRDLNSVVTDIQGAIDENVVLPEGYDIVFGGTAEQMADTFADLSLVVLLAIALVYMILASQFESFLYPFIIMFTLPFTIVGVIWSLLITNQTLNVVSFIGIVMLVGIVVNNAIVLIDYVNRLKATGLESGEAIVSAAAARLRPIVMTTLTTILSMIPLALGIGDGGEMFAPLAVAIIGGLGVSTIITLVLIPVIYAIFDQIKDKRANKKKRKNIKVQEEVAQ
jgi:HAE1 family hydrophobic/amphiphilic exporter-1